MHFSMHAINVILEIAVHDVLSLGWCGPVFSNCFCFFMFLLFFVFVFFLNGDIFRNYCTYGWTECETR